MMYPQKMKNYQITSDGIYNIKHLPYYLKETVSEMSAR